MSKFNDKLKAAVQASLAKSKASKKPKVDDELNPEPSKTGFEAIGIPRSSSRPRELTVYLITYHNRARLDHSKYPNERMRRLENSPVFADRTSAHKWCVKKMKEDRENLYYVEMGWMPEPQIPKPVLKKMKEDRDSA